MTMKNFRGEDMPGKVSHAVDSPQSESRGQQSNQQSGQQGQTGSQQQQPQGQQAQAQSAPPTGQQAGQQSGQQATPEAGSESSSDDDDSSGSPDVPAGTTTEILRWVGDDKQRAQAALDSENQNERPRSGLTSELKKILESA